MQTHRELSPGILYRDRRQTPWAAIFLLRIQRPDLQDRLIGKILCNGDEKSGIVYLSHVRNGAGIVSLERSHDAEGRGDDVDEAIGSADKEVRGSGANA